MILNPLSFILYLFIIGTFNVSISIGQTTTTKSTTSTAKSSTNTLSSFFSNYTNAIFFANTTYASPDTDNRFKNIPGVSLICKLKCPSVIVCNLFKADALWFTKTKSYIKTSSVYYDSVTDELYSYLNETTWAPYVNNYIYCSISSFIYNGTSSSTYNLTSLFMSSNLFYAGLELNVKETNGNSSTYRYADNPDISLQLDEADDKYAELNVTSTVPLNCDKNYPSCGLELALLKVNSSDDDNDKVRTKDCDDSGDCGGCNKQIKSQSNADSKNKANFKLYATIEDKNVQKRKKVKMNFKTKNNFKISNSFVKGMVLPNINIDYVPQNRKVVSAHSYNDPHLKTFDGSSIEFHGKDGEYLVVENENSNLRVHTVSKSCGLLKNLSYTPVYCNYELYVQSFDDLIYFTVASPGVLYYKDLSKTNSQSVKILFDMLTGSGTLPKLTSLSVSLESGRYFKIVTHFSTTIRIEKNNGNYEIYPSKYDFGKVYGLLGNYNGNKSDDLNNTKCGTVSTLKNYFECYRVNNTIYKRPLLSKNEYYLIKEQQKTTTTTTLNANLTRYCMCPTSVNKTTFICENGLKQDNKKEKESRKGQLLDAKKSIISIDIFEDITKKSKLLESSNNNLNNNQLRYKRAAASSCVQVLNISVFQECSKQNLIDLPNLIHLCESDFNDTGLDIWAESYYDNAMTSCKIKLSGDLNNFVNSTNGEEGPQMNVLANLCLNNCNNNGNCSGGICYCYPPFDGADCSINTTSPLRLYNSSSINDICSSNTTSNCLDVLFLVNRITTNLIVNYEIMYKSSNSGSFQLLDKQSSNVYMINDNIIYTQLYNKTKIPNGSLSVYYFNITIKDNATSNSIIYSIINNDCHQCTNSIDCNIKSNKCDIDSICYNVNDTNPLDSSKKCDPSKSALSWTSSTSWTSGVSLIKLNSFICLFLILIYSFFNF